MLDAAHLQEEDARARAPASAARRGATNGRPLYRSLDALNSFDHFGRAASYGAAGRRLPRACAQHSSTPAIFSARPACFSNWRKRVSSAACLFSGDIGNAGRSAAARPGDAAARRHRGDGNDLRRSHAQTAGGLGRGTVRRNDSRLSTAAATSSSRPSLWSARRSSFISCVTVSSRARLPDSAQVYLDLPMASLGHRNLQAPSGMLRCEDCGNVPQRQ